MPASEREYSRRVPAEELERGRREGYGPNPKWREPDKAAKIAGWRIFAAIFGAIWLLGAILHIVEGSI